MKKIRNILCYSHYEFDDIMDKNHWYIHPGDNCACISICSPNEEDDKHWFLSSADRVYNLDIDDCGPVWFGNHEQECYDKALDLYNDKKLYLSNGYFSHVYISGPNNEYCTLLNILDYERATDLVRWITYQLQQVDTIYIHCSAGISRSQAVVRFILDMYSNIYDFKTNPDNPCISPNGHVVLMLKRAFKNLYYNNYNIDNSRDLDEISKQ